MYEPIDEGSWDLDDTDSINSGIAAVRLDSNAMKVAIRRAIEDFEQRRATREMIDGFDDDGYH